MYHETISTSSTEHAETRFHHIRDVNRVDFQYIPAAEQITVIVQVNRFQGLDRATGEMYFFSRVMKLRVLRHRQNVVGGAQGDSKAPEPQKLASVTRAGLPVFGIIVCSPFACPICKFFPGITPSRYSISCPNLIFPSKTASTPKPDLALPLTALLPPSPTTPPLPPKQ